MADGSQKKVSNLKQGDMVKSGDISAKLTCLIKVKCSENKSKFVQIK